MMKNNIIKKYKLKYDNMSIVAKAALWFTFATVLQKGISFITVPIFTRIMTTEQYGIFNVYSSWLGVLTIIGGMEFQTCIYINNLSKMDNDKEKDELTLSLINLSFIITFVWFMIYLFARDFWNSILGIETVMVLFMFLDVFFIPIVSLWSTKQRFTYKYKKLVLFSVLQAILKSVFGIIFVCLSPTDTQAISRAVAIVSIQIIFGLILMIFLLIKTKKLIVTKWWKSALNLHIPLLPHALSLVVLSSADRIMINSICGATQAGLYSLAYSAAMVLNIIKLSLMNAITPWYYNNIKNKEFESIKNKSNQLLILIFIVVIICMLFSPEIIMILGSTEYYTSIYVMPPVLASVFFTFLYNIFSCIEFYYEKTKGIMYASLITATLNIVLNVFVIKHFGFVGAGYTTLVCYLVLSYMHYLFMKKIIKKELQIDRLFDNKFIVLMSIAMLIMTVITTIIYHNNVLRYIFITIILFSVFKFRNKIEGIIDDLKNKKY